MNFISFFRSIRLASCLFLLFTLLHLAVDGIVVVVIIIVFICIFIAGECIPPRTISLAAATFNLILTLANLDLNTFQVIFSFVFYLAFGISAFSIVVIVINIFENWMNKRNVRRRDENRAQVSMLPLIVRNVFVQSFSFRWVVVGNCLVAVTSFVAWWILWANIYMRSRLTLSSWEFQLKFLIESCADVVSILRK